MCVHTLASVTHVCNTSIFKLVPGIYGLYEHARNSRWCMCSSFVLDWSQIGKCAVDGRVQRWKCLTFLSFSGSLKVERKRESARQRGRNMFRPRPNNKELHKHTHKSLLHIHGALLTTAWCFIQHIYVLLTALCQHVGGVFINSVFVVVCRSPESDKPRAGCLSWEGGRVAVETAMPKPDLFCLVQLLDGTIETFNVNVRNTRHSQSIAKEIICCTVIW